jgi:hypothetical protein
MIFGEYKGNSSVKQVMTEPGFTVKFNHETAKYEVG